MKVAARHPSRAHLLHMQVVHSKLASGRWPRLGTDALLASRVKATLASWGFESNRREVSSVEAEQEGEGTCASESKPRGRLRLQKPLINYSYMMVEIVH